VRRPPGDGLAFAAASRCRWLPTGIEGSTCAGSLPVVRRLRSVSGKECRAACLATFPVCTARNPSPFAHRARVLARLLSRASSHSIDRDHKGANFGTRCRPVLNLATSTSYRDDEDSQTPFEDAAPREKSPRLEEYMVYTWDGDLMLSERGFDDYEEVGAHSYSLADGEFAVYNEDGDETIKFFRPWELSGATDSWDTYDTDFVDPLSVKFALSAGFKVHNGYDWNATTSENYRADATPGNFHGAYKDVRARMDYSYHVNYVKSRQLLQDEIVNHWRHQGVSSDRPWIIFTAGAMGAGKSHTVKMLQAFGCCSLTHMSKVDPDTVKYQLPEMVHYIQKNPGPKPDKNIIYAGHATHNESAFIQEIIVREMLEESKSMIIDGSLSNADWYRDYILMIRAKYPHFRIGIIHVVCDADIIWERVQKRCARTGRCIQRHIVDHSVVMAPKAVETLSPLTDFVTVVRSDGDLKDDKMNTIVFQHVREELLIDQLGNGNSENCDLNVIRELREGIKDECSEPGETAGRNIALLESLLAGR